MTDKEIAVAVGTRLIKAEFRIAAMAAELQMYRQDGAPLAWRKFVQETLDSPHVSPIFQERIDTLRRALDEATPQDFLRTLYRSLDQQ
jgi:hypothetical protein